MCTTFQGTISQSGGKFMKTKMLILFLFLSAYICIITGSAFAGEEAGRGISRDKDIILQKQGDLRMSPAGVLEMQDSLSSHHKDPSLQKEITKVIGVFEKKIDDKKVLSRVRHKLATVNEGRLHMIASLSDRIGQDADIENTIAFFLLTTLVIFS